jgi:hypothetical protein
MHTSTLHPISLHARNGTRKYLTAAERRRFLKKAECTQPPLRLFCLVLGWSSGRLSEVLAVTPATIDTELGAVNLRTLKRRKAGVIRQVPLPTMYSPSSSATSTYAPASGIRPALTSGSGRGAAQRHGGTSSR